MAPTTCEACGTPLAHPRFPCLKCALEGRGVTFHRDAAPPPPPSQARTSTADSATATRARDYQPTVRPVRRPAPTVVAADTPGTGITTASVLRWVATAAVLLLLLSGAIALEHHFKDSTPQQLHEQVLRIGNAVRPKRSAPRAAPRTDDALPRDILLTYAPPPKYPAQLLHNERAEGTVRLQIDVDARGRATAIEVIQSSGHPALDEATLDAAQQWRFSPAIEDGQPVSGRITVPVTFALE